MKTSFAIMAVLCVAACSDEGGTENDNEVITTVILDFAPSGGGATRTFTFDDPDGDGGTAPVVDPVALTPGMYTLAVRFQNRLEDPPEEITEEVHDESALHLILFTGSAVVGPATSNTTGPLAQSYADMDANGLPIGLADTIVAAAGAGTLTVTLRHMPPEEPPQKASNTLDLARSGGVDSIGGSTDAQVSFDVTVQ